MAGLRAPEGVPALLLGLAQKYTAAWPPWHMSGRKEENGRLIIVAVMHCTHSRYESDPVVSLFQRQWRLQNYYITHAPARLRLRSLYVRPRASVKSAIMLSPSLLFLCPFLPLLCCILGSGD